MRNVHIVLGSSPARQTIVVPVVGEVWSADRNDDAAAEASTDLDATVPDVFDPPCGSYADALDPALSAPDTRPECVTIIQESRGLTRTGISTIVVQDARPPADHETTLPARSAPLQHLAVPSAQALDLSRSPVHDSRQYGLRGWPAAVLVLILLIVAANIAFSLYSQGKTERSIENLRASVVGAGNDNAVALIQEIRREVRERAQAERQQLRVELAALLDARAGADPESSTEQLLLLQQILAEIRAPAAPAPAAAADPSAARRGVAAKSSSAAGATATPAESSENAQAAAHSETPAAVVAPPDTVFFIDASEDLAGAMPLVMSELRRSIDQIGRRKQWSVLVFSGDELVEVPMERSALLGSLGAAGEQESLPEKPAETARPCAGITDALREALRQHPGELYIFSTALAAKKKGKALGPGLLELFRELNDDRGTRIHTIQFFARDQQELLLNIARENGGTYTLIAPPSR